MLMAAAEKLGEMRRSGLSALVVIRELRLRSAWLFDIGKRQTGLCRSPKRPPQTAAATKEAGLKPGTTWKKHRKNMEK
jgi:hypothetical protein